MDWQNKNVLVVGLGKSGIAAAEALLRLGARVSVYDKKPAKEMDPQICHFFENQNVVCYFGADPEDVASYHVVVMSPGVPLTLPFVEKAKEAGAEIIGELELAYQIGRGAYIAITGTNGKTTTTVLVGEIFKNAGRKTEVVGNVGIAVVSKAISATDDTWLITETSSFQLESTKTFKPKVSALLNITPDHMDRHKTLENYANAKGMIFQNQTTEESFVVNLDDPGAWGQAEKCRAAVIPFSRKEVRDTGCFVADGRIVIREKGISHDVCGADELIIPGGHNLENALAATAVSYFAGIPIGDIARTLREFQGVEHRLEYCGEICGVRFVNDSKGTNPDAAIKAIEAMKGKVVLIAGGYDKKSEFEEFIGAFNDKVKCLVLMGQTAQKIKETAHRQGFDRIVLAKDMEECVRSAYAAAERGDTVLLSPACASWDMYQSYEQRGRHFKFCVKSLER